VFLSVFLKGQHHEGNDTGQGDGADELSSATGGLGGVGASGRGGGATAGGRGGGSGGDVTIDDQVGASNTGAVVVDDDGTTQDATGSGASKDQLLVNVGLGGDDTILCGRDVAVLARQVTDLASGQVSGVAGLGGTDVVGVQVKTGGHAVTAGGDGGDVDVVLETDGDDGVGGVQTRGVVVDTHTIGSQVEGEESLNAS